MSDSRQTGENYLKFCSDTTQAGTLGALVFHDACTHQSALAALWSFLLVGLRYATASW